VFPNPNYGLLNISSDEEIIEIRIIDLMGRIKLSTPYLGEPINLNALGAQTYIVEIQKKNKTEKQKLILMK
jgi:hypothetical protein